MRDIQPVTVEYITASEEAEAIIKDCDNERTQHLIAGCIPLSNLKQVIFGKLRLKGDIYVNIQNRFGIHYWSSKLAEAFSAQQER